MFQDQHWQMKPIKVTRQRQIFPGWLCIAFVILGLLFMIAAMFVYA